MDSWEFILQMNRFAKSNETCADIIFGMVEKDMWGVRVNTMPHMKVYQGLGDWVLLVEGFGATPDDACEEAYTKLSKKLGTSFPMRARNGEKV
jgi:hypothetical protein